MRVVIGLAVIVCLPCLQAQTSTGSLGGFALDSSSAAIPGARITIRNAATADTYTATTGNAGEYVFPLLLPGTYEMTAEAAGFKRTVRVGIVVEVQQTVRVDPVLEVGNVSETVEVKAEIPLLQPSTSSLGQVVDNQKILDLPLEGRNTIELMTLTTGVTPLAGFGGLPALGSGAGQGNVSVGGSGGMTSSTSMDGAPGNGFLTNAPAFIPSVDTVGEFKVQTNAFSAEFGRTTGAVINVWMKSGTNAIHGGVFEFLRNSGLDANSFFNNSVGAAKAQVIYNLFGGTIGGPLWVPKVYHGRDRSFFFVAYEGFRQRQGLKPIKSVPSLLERGGDFSQSVTSMGVPVNVFDPLTVHATTATAYARDPFPGNRVPQSRFDPVASNVIKYFPAPNLPGNPINHTRNFIGDGRASNSNNQASVKIDQHFLTGHRLFGRYSRNATLRGAGQVLGKGNPFSGLNPAGGGVPLTLRSQQAMVRDSFTASPTLLAEYSFGVTRWFIHKVPWSYGRPLTDLGFPESLSSAMPEYYYPNFSFTNFDALNATSGDLIHRGDYSNTLQGSLTRIAGRSTLKIGGEYRLMRANDYQPPGVAVFSFDATWTRENPRTAATGSGYDLASFLLGHPVSGSVAAGTSMSIQSHFVAGYVQNDWRVSRRLTLNLGVRYELETPRTERFNRLNWFDFTAPSPLASVTGVVGLRGGLQFAGVNGNGRRQKLVDANNIAPRVGFAFSLNRQTTIRGGFGIFYAPLGGNTLGNELGNGGYAVSTAMVTTTDTYLTAAATLRNPFPAGISKPVGNTQGLATLVGQSLTAVNHTDPLGYVEQYNFNVQRLLPGRILIDAAYAGSHQVHVTGFREYNQLNPDYYPQKGALIVNVSNPFARIVSSGTLSSSVVTTAQMLRPYPQFLNVSVQSSRGSSTYNALQLKLERRMAAGMAVLVSYTAAKVIGDANPTVTYQTGDIAGSYQNNWNYRLERSLLTWDVSQRIVVTYSYILPVGRGKHFGAKWSRTLDAIAGGWQLNGLATAQVGTPLVLTLASANTYGGTRPNSKGFTANLPAEQKTRDRWFNTAAFTQPPAYSLGTVSRSLPDVRGPGISNIDCSLFKTLTLAEKWKVQIRAEVFNLLNHTSFGNPNVSFGSANFGLITSARAARRGQIALKLNF